MGSGITRCTPPVERRSDDAGCGDHGTVTGQRFWRARRPIYCSAVQGGTPHATRPKRTDLIQRDALLRASHPRCHRLRETTQPTRCVVCADVRHLRSLRGWPSCCSPEVKVPQVECTGDDDAEDEQCLWEGHEQAAMAGKLKGQKNQHPKRKGQAPTDGCKPCHIPGVVSLWGAAASMRRTNSSRRRRQ